MNDKILKTLKRGPKKGLTAFAIAERTGFNLNSVRSALVTLQSTEEITVAGTAPATKGRPANLYTITA